MRTANYLRPRGVMSTRALIWTAFGRNAAKKIEAGLNISRSQAWRIVSLGTVPRQLEGAFIELAYRHVALRRQELSQVDEALRLVAYERALAHRESAPSLAADRSAAPIG